jgi:hypothetical protein
LIVVEKDSSRIRVPVRAAIAFASAGATIGTLASPTPVGCLVESIKCTSMPGTEPHPHDRVPIEVLSDDLAAVTEDDLAPRRGAQPPAQSTLYLGADEVGG